MKQSSFNFYCRSILLAILFCNTVYCSKSSKTYNDWYRMNLKEHVQQIDEIRYASYQDLISKKDGEKSFTRFDKKGLITKNALYMNHGQIHWMKYLYKSDSVWIDELRELENNSEHPQSYWLYKVNEQGHQYAITSYNLDSSVNFHIDLEFNNHDKVDKINYSQQYHPTRVPCKIIKLYDEAGNLKEEHSYQYDEATKKCAETYTRSIIKLNEQGDLEREILYFPSGDKRVHSYKYKYDEHGNWTEKQHYDGDFAEEVIFRTLTYFPDSVLLEKK